MVQGGDDNLYGRTYYGGASNLGTLFQISTNGVFTSLYSFTGTNGAYPFAALTLGADGNFYGTAEKGGANDQDGALFRMTPGGAVTTLAWFNGDNGVFPLAPLVRADDRTFYGTTFNGSYGYGNVFRLSLSRPPAPVFQSADAVNGRITLAWSAIAGQSYQVQFTTNLSSGMWANLGGTSLATNQIGTATDVTGQDAARFYRVFLAH